MKEKTLENREILELVSVQTGYTKTNLKRTYKSNQNNKDKTKIVRVMIVGSRWTEIKATDSEIDLAIDLIQRIREANAK